jgi:hypothetical protein
LATTHVARTITLNIDFPVAAGRVRQLRVGLGLSTSGIGIQSTYGLRSRNDLGEPPVASKWRLRGIFGGIRRAR